MPSTDISPRVGDKVAAPLDAAAGRTGLPLALPSALATSNLDRLGSALASAGSTSALNLACARIAQDAVKASRFYDVQLFSPDLARSMAPLHKSAAVAALATQPRFNIDPNDFKQLSATLEYPALNPVLLAQLNGTTGVLADVSRKLADIGAMHARTLNLSALAVSASSSHLDGLPTLPHPPRWREAVYARHGTRALAASDLLRGDPISCQPAVVEQVELIVVEPWREGLLDVREELNRALAELDPEIVNLLDGAWVDVQEPGPGALVKISSCAVEALDRALRTSAPDRDVLDWVAGRGPRLLDDKGRPTRGARVRYLLRNRKGDQKLVEVQVEAAVTFVNELVGRLQATKHASVGDITVVRAHLVSVESILGQLYVVHD
jgi:hypothetical protein